MSIDPNLEFVIDRIRMVADDLDRNGRVDAMRTWPKGANGPLAVAAYEALRDEVFRAIVFLRATALRAEGGSVPEIWWGDDATLIIDRGKNQVGEPE